MKRITLMFCVMIGLIWGTGSASAGWGQLTYSGYQPWWNIFAKRYKCLTPEEERLQKFWHDYYHALKEYYSALDNIDWVAYYKNHGCQINCGGGGNCGRINYYPVFVSPRLEFANPAPAQGGGSPVYAQPYGGAGMMQPPAGMQ